MQLPAFRRCPIHPRCPIQARLWLEWGFSRTGRKRSPEQSHRDEPPCQEREKKALPLCRSHSPSPQCLDRVGSIIMKLIPQDGMFTYPISLSRFLFKLNPASFQRKYAKAQNPPARVPFENKTSEVSGIKLVLRNGSQFLRRVFANPHN
jgi:hypothetical protein